MLCISLVLAINDWYYRYIYKLIVKYEYDVIILKAYPTAGKSSCDPYIANQQSKGTTNDWIDKEQTYK